jgi:MoaD family protein
MAKNHFGIFHHMEIKKKTSVFVKYFSILAQITNKRDEMISLDKGENLTYLLDLLSRKYPDLKKYAPYTVVAVNQNYVSLDYQPKENDEIALITPVSGG